MRVTVLKSTIHRKRRSALQKVNSSGRPALGSHDAEKGSYVSSTDVAVGAGRMGTLNPVNSLGRQWIGDLEAVKRNAAHQYRKDRRSLVMGV